jgi:hypothetical protein
MNIRFCRRQGVILAVTPIAGHGGGVTGGNLDQDDLDAIGILDPHLDQSTWHRCRLPG